MDKEEGKLSNKAKNHYDILLGGIYSWMAGDFKEKVSEARSFFKANDIIPKFNKIAVDLGSGHGIQSAALNELGFTVTAVDFSGELLAELKQNLGDKVKTINADITGFRYDIENKPELIVCMGDTLTHLSSIEEVKNLINNAANGLCPEGKLVLSYRDMSKEVTGTGRFIPVKSDDKRILTCFLEYLNDCVNVNDILYENIDGEWKMKVNSYPKLRLPVNSVHGLLEESGFKISFSKEINGMHYIISQKS